MLDILFKKSSEFADPVLQWFDHHGRSSLPWQQDQDPYKIWISEIMLQQTQVQTVIPYYQKFIVRFPKIHLLAEAQIDEVMNHWAGLGYYARARNLHKAAQLVRDHHNGRFPDQFEQIMALPGIGRSTAGAIAALAFNARHPILDGNVKRVLTRYFAIEGHLGEKHVIDKLWQLADQLTPDFRVGHYTQAIMDLGALVCKRHQPNCLDCPLQNTCKAGLQGTAETYPKTKPKGSRPQRYSRMLMIRNPESEFLMVKRPPSGIWGGLWVLPEIAQEVLDDKPDDKIWCETNLGLFVGDTKPLNTVDHSFTHFRLRIKPMMCDLIGQTDTVMDGDGYIWYNPQCDKPIAIPKAIQKIFDQLTQ